jgi:F-type H+-transporting ATPase subunit a
MGFLPFVFPLAELEVGQHLYWQIGNFRIHGQVFMTSWLLIGALLALVVLGTKKMERDPKGLQNLLEFLWDYIRDLARTQIGEKVYRDWMPFIGTPLSVHFCEQLGRCISSLEADQTPKW